MKFRKKPVEVEAMRWDGTAEGATPILDWILAGDGTATYWCSNPTRCSEHDGDTPHAISIHTLEGSMDASVGDWVIRGVQGEFYPCKPDIFEETYDAVTPVTEDALTIGLNQLREMLRMLGVVPRTDTLKEIYTDVQKFVVVRFRADERGRRVLSADGTEAMTERVEIAIKYLPEEMQRAVDARAAAEAVQA